MSDKNQSVKVVIYGEDYPIRGDGDLEQIKSIAAYVDKKMREIGERSYNKSPKDVAILAALNIASELFELREKEQELVQINDRAQSLLDKLEDEIKPTATP
ncbi:MAG: cell division protein ZapA [candidate division Zixibacteria bacterium]|jgi:cell division protein ZapA|nr:cell division protein ZapA [candidate division Zixibacteria bacterium]